MRERLHDNTLTFSGISEQLANYYNLLSGRIFFTYESYGERGSDTKSKFFSGDGKIEDHWVKDNILKRIRALTLSNLDLQLEMIKGD